jgi:hypothetical protein
MITDYFEHTHTLRVGMFPTAPRPFRTFNSDTTTYHLTPKLTMTNATVDSATELYELPDLKPAITDYLDHHHPNFTHTIRGRQ